MRQKFIDMTGQKYARLTVLSYSGKGRWLCQCSCGTIKEIPGYNMRHGICTSCGCYRIEKAISDGFKHGLSDTPIHKRWMDMHQRCYNTGNSRYSDWGGRGIKICDRWHKNNPDGFMNYVEDINKLGEKPGDSFTLDRINNDGNYSPDNVRWSDKREQRNNQRNHRTRAIEYKGITRSMKDWSLILKTHPSNILYYIKRGKDFDFIYNHYMRNF
jgi:hypothetical protein